MRISDWSSDVCSSDLLMNMEDFGVPQRRRRCIAGNFDYDLLAKYGPGHAPTLGSVIKALSADPVVDPIYCITIPRHELFDQDVEGPLHEDRKSFVLGTRVSVG